MRLLDITFQNLRRRSGKALLVVTCLTVAITMVTAMVTSNRALEASISSKMDDYGANIVVAPKSDQLALTYGGMTLPGVVTQIPEFDANVVDRIASVPGGANMALAPKVVGGMEISGGQVLLVGVDFATEMGMKKWWRLDGTAPAAQNDVLLGANTASRLGAKPGDSIVIAGSAFDVAAILAPTGSSEDDVIMADLAVAQSLLGRVDRVTFVEVSAPRGASVETIAEAIGIAVPEARVMPIKQAIESKKQVMERFSAFGVGLSVLVLIASGFSVLTMMMSSVNQRTREIGILRAVGYKKAHISAVVLSEALIMSLVGGVAGAAAGSALGRVIAVALFEAVTAPVEATTIMPLVLLAIATGLASATYPALRAASIDPARALRFI